MDQVAPIPLPSEIKKLYSLSSQSKRFLMQSRETARAILHAKEYRKAFIIGPCSIHDKVSALEYARQFKELAAQVRETCFLIMRVYCEKSRTSTGWKGLLYDPHLDGSHDIYTGLQWTRELLLMLAEWQVPTAAEFVDPLAAAYFEDLITWGFIGARTSASQPHRQFASSLDFPIGFKNSTDGNLDDAIHGVSASSISHSFLSVDENGMLCAKRSRGNPYTHIVLRGANDFTNYDALAVSQADEKLKKAHLCARILIDCSHGNCHKQYDRQKEAFYNVLEQLERGNETICGLMLESHLESGYQLLGEDPSTLKKNISITDPCIDWETTQDLILAAHHSLSGFSSVR